MSVQEVVVEESEFVFETVMRVRNTEVGVGQYLTIDALTSILTEAKSRFFSSKGIEDMDDNSQGLIITDMAINFPEMVKAKEDLLIEVGVPKINKKQAIMKFRVNHMHKMIIIAKACMTLVNFDFNKDKVVPMSAYMLEHLEQKPFAL